MTLIVGLTGGIGSGKSMVADMFKTLQVPVYKSDIEAKKLMLSQPEIKAGLKSLFGNDIYTPFGDINRDLMRKRMFDDDSLREKINQIVHPKVRQHFVEWVKASNKARYVIQEAAILFESGAHKNTNLIITVTAPEPKRIKRVMHRDSITQEQVKAIIAKQYPEDFKIRNSDFVIDNNEKELLIPQILKVHQKLLEKKSSILEKK